MSNPMRDRDWEADSDARALIRAEQIRADGKRLTRAKKALGRVVKEAEEAKSRAIAEANAAKRLRNL